MDNISSEVNILVVGEDGIKHINDATSVITLSMKKMLASCLAGNQILSAPKYIGISDTIDPDEPTVESYKLYGEELDRPRISLYSSEVSPLTITDLTTGEEKYGYMISLLFIDNSTDILSNISEVGIFPEAEGFDCMLLTRLTGTDRISKTASQMLEIEYRIKII